MVGNFVTEAERDRKRSLAQNLARQVGSSATVPQALTNIGRRFEAFAAGRAADQASKAYSEQQAGIRDALIESMRTEASDPGESAFLERIAALPPEKSIPLLISRDMTQFQPMTPAERAADSRAERGLDHRIDMDGKNFDLREDEFGHRKVQDSIANSLAQSGLDLRSDQFAWQRGNALDEREWRTGEREAAQEHDTAQLLLRGEQEEALARSKPKKESTFERALVSEGARSLKPLNEEIARIETAMGVSSQKLGLALDEEFDAGPEWSNDTWRYLGSMFGIDNGRDENIQFDKLAAEDTLAAMSAIKGAASEGDRFVVENSVANRVTDTPDMIRRKEAARLEYNRAARNALLKRRELTIANNGLPLDSAQEDEVRAIAEAGTRLSVEILRGTRGLDPETGAVLTPGEVPLTGAQRARSSAAGAADDDLYGGL